VTPEFSLHQLTKCHWRSWLFRFVFGGAVAVAAGCVAELLGPGVGGLFLAFPSILPASLTLVKSQEGRDAACDGARGALLGSLGMLVFAICVWITARWQEPVFSLALALTAWIATSVGAWWLMFRGEPAPPGHARCTPVAGVNDDGARHGQ
jgi:hypothetical protein